MADTKLRSIVFGYLLGDIVIINLANVWIFAQTEIRLTKRLARYWIFLVLAYLMCLLMYFQYSVVHTVGSSISASIGFVGPRYLISLIGLFYLVAFVTGIVFLAFDIRARDTRERMLEVLDSRPYFNLELVLGRFIGLFLSAWIPIVILVLFVQSLGWLLPQLGSPFGQTIEPFSLLSFPVFIALPAIAFSCSVVIFITLLVRIQFIALVLSIGLIAGLYFLSSGILPFAISSSLDLIGFYQVNLPSDWVPSIAADYSGWLQRAGVLFISLGLVFFAALIHPRLRSGNHRLQTFNAIAVSLIGIALLITVLQIRTGEIDKIEQWRLAHVEKSHLITPDIVSIQGTMKINPALALTASLALDIKAPPEKELKRALFSLNPGFELTHIKDKHGNDLTASFENGLLEIVLSEPLAADEQTSVKLDFHGKPDLKFAYLDSAINYRDLSFSEDNVKLLGYDNAIFSENYVALMPGIYWLPASGTDAGKGENRGRHKDSYALQLSVQTPEDWIVAGPGLRTNKGVKNDYLEFEFSPASAISEVALLAAPFKSYVTKIDNITFELLLHPDHHNNIEIFTQGNQQIKQWIADKLSLAQDIGLNYPFRAFSLVEVPNTLRGYTGGWRMDTSLAPPSMVLMKETGLPTARFDYDAVETFGKGRALNDEDDGDAKIIRNRLIEFFTNDFTGGNVFTGAAQSYFAHQTSATGGDAIALDYALGQLATLVLSGQRSYFSVARISDLNNTMQAILGAEQQSSTSISDQVINTISQDHDVWESALTSPLNNLDPWKDPSLTVDLLALKAGGLANIIYDILGPVKTGRLLANLLDNHKGLTYTRADVVAAGRLIDPKLETLIEDLFTGTGLAGFTGEQVRLYQLPENDNGDIRFQLRMRINNDEDVAGYTRVSWLIAESNKRTYSEPIRIPGKSAVEFGVVLSEAPVEAYIEPYLSLNRKDFLVKTFDTSNFVVQDKEAFNGVQELTWKPPGDGKIIVDDLDNNFSIVSNDTGNAKKFQLAGLGKGIFDQGLPVSTLKEIPSQWSRHQEKTAWGKYRHTFAFIRPGDSNNRVSFEAKIPSSGRWKLELHLPRKWLVKGDKLGNWQIDIIAENKRESIEFNANDWLEGWSLVGNYELLAGNVRVEFTNRTDGYVVIADAIAWSPLD